MIIEVEKGRRATIEQIRDLAARFGNRVEITEGDGFYCTVHVIGDTREFATREGYIRDLPGVRKAFRIESDHKNIARVARGEGGLVRRPRRVVEVPGLDGKVRRIGTGKHVFIVGPDSPQTMEQTLAIARAARSIGERYGILDRMILRGGAFKPRTRPTDWRGLGMQGIAMLDAAREETGLPYATEVMDHNLAPEIAEHADMLQIGTRNAQNFDLLEAVGRLPRPVILKRGFGNEANEWFFAAEYVANQGNLDIVLCERGMKTLFTKGGYCRNQPDFNAITHARKTTILPVIFDPSHVAGDHRIVPENLVASLGHLVDGTITETLHDEAFRKEQLCDAGQALLMDHYARVVEAVLAFEEHVRPHLEAVLADLDVPV
ncbi:MAG: 3-deoxy-D-arabino-heptulosonate 7-phosphate synthase [Deltaproteobacteria bacterium]|nr:MAG: 3-deoxy-D-arabino-heptulosonate 7-phosphate synthase [Deltaproteobacteria bacterium]